MSKDEDFSFQPEALSRALSLLSEYAAEQASVVPEPPSFRLSEGLPAEGIGGIAALENLAGDFFPSAARLGHPGYFAHMDPPTPWFTWVGALWAASCNQNLLHTDTGKGARELEEKVVASLSSSFGMNGGHLVPGSTLANITALWAARELRGIRNVVVSDMAHLSIRKAASLLNLNLYEVPTNSQHQLQPEAVADVEMDETAVVLMAGTVAAGAIDPLDAFPEAAWRHVDAAWGGPLRLTRYAGLLDGVEAADSVSMSAHKWLFQPKDSAIVMFRRPDEAHDAISFGGGYLAVPNVGLLGSHGSTALPLAATLLAWGRQGIAARIEHCMQLAERLAARIDEEPALELFGSPVTGVVLWRPRNESPSAVRERMEGAFVSLTQIGGESWFRSVAANPQADPDRVVDSALSALRRGP
ncbi:aspartate aminotransferase family protein [Halovibrio salipaludis]|uniref:Aspartate aminotransferase family protein n=1 Tax=Halovibrio salipaludis TaxID=2032626 RepID=A0A2A2FCT5_9GAMM|nr:pyridoxal-dependent decarboxylase [Halovibrio salipaludis]PAU82363.1 aspartate aminotransferase family protein [Halovibrio salipaludis]